MLQLTVHRQEAHTSESWLACLDRPMLTVRAVPLHGIPTLATTCLRLPHRFVGRFEFCHDRISLGFWIKYGNYIF